MKAVLLSVLAMLVVDSAFAQRFPGPGRPGPGRPGPDRPDRDGRHDRRDRHDDGWGRGDRGRRGGPTERLVIDLFDRVFRGQNQRIFLRQELQRNYPRLDLERYDLIRVRLEAKSQAGHGQASLEVGHREKDRRGIPGNPGDFHRPGGHYPIILENYDDQDRGAWQIRLDGNIKVDRVVVVLEYDRFGDGGRPGPGPRPPMPPRGAKHICGHGPDQFVPDTQTCNVNEQASGIRIDVQKGTVEIQSVEVIFGNGERQRVHLQGRYQPGDQPFAHFGFRNVRTVIVTATSPQIFPKSELQIYLLQ